MTAAQKEAVFQMLKKTSAAVLGYQAAEFSAEERFFDDQEIPKSAPASFSRPESAGVGQAPSDGGLVPQEGARGLASGAIEEAAAPAASIDSVAKKIASCARCPLSKTRKNVVPGEGVLSPAVLVIGEAPGADEDERGRPFVGRAGQLLDKMLGAIGLSRQKNCFIANIVKCRPPMNRDPSPEEAAACRSFLDAQIHLLKPKMVLAMGRVALQKLLDTSMGINRMRGQILDFKGTPFMATYHPSALLRDESLKRPAWEDLKAFRQKLLELCPDYDK